MKTGNYISVYYHDRSVGTLAETARHMIAFEYDRDWLQNGFAISPFSLPLRESVFIPEKHYFQGLFGVFADSLPDSWGRLLMDRYMISKGIPYNDIRTLDRLSFVGDHGMGALCYRPSVDYQYEIHDIDLDVIAEECGKLLLSQPVANLDDLYKLGGTSGGARPKIMLRQDGRDWIVKFPAHTDSKDIGKMEYDYAICAAKCGIDMMPVKLFPSELCQGYYGNERFDVVNDDHGSQEDVVHEGSHRVSEELGYRLHTVTVAGLLELDHEQPSLDYTTLMKLTRIMTQENKHDIENMYLRMCFNVEAHNRDDHSKNFSFLFDEIEDRWRLAPAYDLTYSNTYYGEHTTSVAGNGKDPGVDEILAVGTGAGLSKKKCRELYDRVYEIVHKDLKEYL